ncbi:MAG: virulence RhuM family protein [Paludibacteraceae bacterium]|nr:virulence RhuM family protein [Paludibacteraceae bacterium]
MANELALYNPSDGSVVVYQSEDGTLQLDVQLKEESVWLTQEQIATLFGTQRPAISKHLNNIFTSGELDSESTCSILEHMGNDGKQRYQTKYYNLDAILAVGYRVNTRNAACFRRWATNVLKEYLLRGYAINQRLIAVEDCLDRRLQEHSNQIQELQQKVDFFVRTNQAPVEQVFFGGEFFAARVLLEQLIKTAKNRVVIIDAYVDAATFDILDVRAKDVEAAIYCGKDLSGLRDAHNATAGVEPIDTFVWTNPSHDRWLIIDDQLYHCGHSLKDMGKKLSAISLMGIPAQTIIDQVK